MCDSPVAPAPVGAQEKPILDKLLLIRDKLLLLKEDKSTYVKSSDVIPLYDEIIEQVQSLNDVRGPEHLIQNRVDTVLDDCFLLVSLFFLAIGRNNEAPAVYSMTATMTRLCEHLKEAAFYSTKDVQSLQDTLDRMERTMKTGAEKYSPYLITRIHHRMEIIQQHLDGLKEFLSTLSPQMVPTWEKLVSLLRALAAVNIRSKFSLKDLNELRGKLLEIKNTMSEGKLPDSEGHTSGGQDLVVPLLERCLRFSDITEKKYVLISPCPLCGTNSSRQGKVDAPFRETFDELCEIKNHLDRLTMTQAWSLRETDLYQWQRKLDRLDDSRRDGNFFCSGGHPADLHTQRVRLWLHV